MAPGMGFQPPVSVSAWDGQVGRQAAEDGRGRRAYGQTAEPVGDRELFGAGGGTHGADATGDQGQDLDLDPGDTLAVPSPDRYGRSLQDLIDMEAPPS
ncbi:hypothetical protein OG244_17500 [Streptomyces brevispora]|uniref:hypothetical protein n=1 Tax=Streptomyces brevispora TaxID=887462 RepID=UPI002E311314|nr:hypothetical protein [Streptomyces brevispora]